MTKTMPFIVTAAGCTTICLAMAFAQQPNAGQPDRIDDTELRKYVEENVQIQNQQREWVAVARESGKGSWRDLFEADFKVRNSELLLAQFDGDDAEIGEVLEDLVRLRREYLDVARGDRATPQELSEALHQLATDSHRLKLWRDNHQ